MTQPVVCLDARKTRQMSVGMKAYVDELVARLPRVAPEFAYAAFAEGANFGFAEQVRMPRAMRARRPSVTHVLSQYVPLLVPRPFVLTIHDLIHLRHPQFFKAKVGPYYRTVVRAACARAARVITDDERTRDDLARFLGVPEHKVCVVPLGVNERFFAETVPYRGARPYLLYVGNHRAHKDLPTLFDAWSALPSDCSVDLYVTGPDDFSGELQRRATADRRIVALGDVGDRELVAYYRGATALVHPALCEGFGLPLLEAMAGGCPVVCSDGALPAVLAPAALAYPTGDARGLTAVLLRLLSDQGLRTTFVNKGAEMAATLTWDRCARATADVYRDIMDERCARR